MNSPNLAPISFLTWKCRFVLVTALWSACPMLGATLTVTTTNDNGAGSFRKAVREGRAR